MPAHLSIMVPEILEGLRVADSPHARWIDGTVGAGGHSEAILSSRSDSHLMGLDLDPSALQLAAERLAPFGGRVLLRHGSYLTMREAAAAWLDDPAPHVDGILLDLGISSMQVDQGERGFSFRQDAPLDMRFDPTSPQPTAADLLNSWGEGEIADLLYHYGEETNSRRIARAIMAQRPIESTLQLAELVASLHRGKREKIHPATRTFQALRIAVNQELDTVEAVLPLALDLLKAGGRLAVMSFHSLEDRIVKQYFREAATDCICPPRQPLCTCDHRAVLRLITRKPLMAGAAEVATNPRARSAKLRIVEKLP